MNNNYLRICVAGVVMALTLGTVHGGNLIQGTVDVVRGKKSDDAKDLKNQGQGVIDITRGKNSEQAKNLKEYGQGAIDAARGKNSEEANRLLSSPLVTHAFPIESIGLVAIAKPEMTEEQLRTVAGANAGTVVRVVETYQTVQAVGDGVLGMGAEAVLGEETGRAVVRLTRGQDQIISQLAYSSALATKSIVEGKDISLLRGILLAGALRDGYAQLINQAKPVPDIVLQRMVICGFDPAVTASQKYVVDSGFSITLPGFTNLFQEKILRPDGGHAVTILNLIVFSGEPPTDSASTKWWAHEFAHTGQYLDWGIEKFASKYVAHSGDVESEANKVGAECPPKIEAYKNSVKSL